MHITRLDLQNFRCHTNRTFEFGTQPTLITGPNGVGKTSILEAINMIGVSKSFLPVTDSDLVSHGAAGYRIDSRITHDLGTQLTITIEYTSGSTKQIKTSATGQCSAQELIGLLPCVVLASIHRELFFGEPSIRRAFVDRILAQSHASYKHALWRHRIALRQRNRLLATMASGFELDAWTDELITATAEILWRRKHFIVQFNAIASECAATFGLVGITPHLEYRTPWLSVNYQPDTWDTSQERFHQQLANNITTLFPLDLERLSTQWGPQRDLVTVVNNGYPISSSASQGQQKLALYVIKLAETKYLHHVTDRAPVLLLDDVFADLDEYNMHQLEESILRYSTKWQIFLTAPSSQSLAHHDAFAILRLGEA
jgi:DNA replication and repair protein RecF